MTIGAQDHLARAKIRKWRDLHSGWLIIQRGTMSIYRQKFLGALEEMATFDTRRLKSVKQNGVVNGIQIAFYGADGGDVEELIAFAAKDHAESARAVLIGLLEEAEEQRRQQEEEKARLEREHLETLGHLREAFASEVWETAQTLWAMSSAVYSMIRAVISGNSGDAREQYSTIWKQCDKFESIHKIDLNSALNDLDGAIHRENAKEAIQKSARLLTALSEEILKSETMWAKWREHKDMLAAVSPNYNYMPFFLLFANTYFEASLAAWIEDWTGLSRTLPALRSSCIVLERCFSLDLHKHFDQAFSAIADRDARLFFERASEIESAAFTSFKVKPFTFNEPDQQPEVRIHGAMPK